MARNTSTVGRSSTIKLLDRAAARVAAAARVSNHHNMFDVLETRQLLSASSFATPDYVMLNSSVATPDSLTGPTETNPTAMRQAYGINQISVNGVVGTGAGQTIAIVDAYYDPDITADLHTFDADFGLSNPTLTLMEENGSLITTSNHPSAPGKNSQSGSWASEEALDVEWAHVIAPSANILLIEANSSSYSDLFAGVTRAGETAGVSVVSMSWGGSEVNSDSYFTAPGVTYLSASGDSGAGASSPATSANVIAVGGTTLMVDSNGNLGSEEAWDGSGGGVSAIETEPAYQKAIVPASITTTNRAEPDVSFDADPYSGVEVIDSYDFSGPVQFGGTSLATPSWAGIIAITNQELVAAGKPVLNTSSADSTLPMLYALPSSDFRDITANYTADYSGNPAYAAGPGYDLATGRGSPIANKLVADLVGVPATPQPVINSFTVNPTSVEVGTSATLTANVTDAGSTISTVAFYAESNNTAGLQTTGDTFLGDGMQSGSNWSFNVSTTGLATGAYTYYALATDAASVTTATGTSAPSTTLTVTPVPAPQPVIGSVTVNPTSVTVGTSATVTANNVTDAGSTITGVTIYRESNGTAGLQTSGDTLIGNATKSGSNWSITVSTTGLTPGNYTYYALATDSANVTSPTGTSAPSATLGVTAASANLFTTDTNIGSPNPNGTGSFNSTTGVYTVTGAGSDIYDKSDQFNYYYTSYSGNGSIVAQVTSQTNTNSSANAGVMFRNSTAANAMFVDVVATPSSGLEFEYRSSTGGNVGRFIVGGIDTPVWVKITRSGNTFTTYYATTTGAPTSWKEIGVVTVGLSTNALAGLAVCSHNNGTLGTATFATVQLGVSTLGVPATQPADPRSIAWNFASNGASGQQNAGSSGASNNDSGSDSLPSLIVSGPSSSGSASQDFTDWTSAIVAQSDDAGAWDAAITDCFSDLIAVDG